MEGPSPLVLEESPTEPGDATEPARKPDKLLALLEITEGNIVSAGAVFSASILSLIHI